jgi:hypothetical protein
MSTPLGEKTLATRRPVSLDHTSQRTFTPAMRAARAAKDIAPTRSAARAPERLVEFGGVDAVQPDKLIGDDDRVAFVATRFMVESSCKLD